MNAAKNTPLSFWAKIRLALSTSMHRLGKACRKVKTRCLKNFAHWVDPKLEKYRTPRPSDRTLDTNYHTSSTKPRLTEVKSLSENLTPRNPQHANSSELYTPKTINEFLDLLRRTPRTVLNNRERHVIATIMNFPDIKVSEIMLPGSAITYVKDDEVLGPLVLDRLYRSGFQHFPVINPDHRIIGIIHTTALNSLEIKETSHAHEILDPKVYYLREDYTLNQALAAFLRTNCYFFLVIDRFERIVGMLTYQMLVDFLLGETPTDDFDRDSDRLAVAKRKMC